MEPIYNLKVAENKKDKKWYKQLMDYIVPINTSAVWDYQKMRGIYAILNNDITYIKANLDSLCRPLGEEFSLPFEIDEEIVVYNKLFPKFMYLVGQMNKRKDALDIVFSSDSANEAKTRELREIYERSINELIQITFEQADMANQGASPEELQQYYEQMRSQIEPQDLDVKTFKSEVEEFYADVIDYFKYKFNTDRLKELSFKHAVASDKCFIGIIEENGRPVPKIFNPLHFGFHKSPDIEYIQHGDYWWHKQAITISQAYDELQHKVSKEELEKLATYTGISTLRPNDAWDVKSGKAQPQYDYSHVQESWSATTHERYVGQAMGSGSSRRYNTERLVWKTYMEFKAYRKVIFLTYTDEYGKVIVEVVPDSFEIPKEATTVRFKNKWGMDSKRKEWVDLNGNPMYAEELWIPRRYEVTRYGSELYVDCREVPNQPISLDNPFEFELSAKGKIFTSLNSEPISLVERALPSLLQYIFIKNLQNRELSKYEGFIKNIDTSRIPDMMPKDEDGNPLYEGVDNLAIWRYFRRKLGDSYFDDSMTSTGLPNYQKSTPIKPEISGAISEILAMQNVLDLIDREMGFQMLVPPQAEGIYEPNSNVSDNQQALQQGYTQAEPYYLAHNEIWRAVTNEYLKQFREYYIRYFEENPESTETHLHYITPEGSRKTITVTPDKLQHEDFGLFLYDGSYSESYRQYMTSLLHAVAQNQGEGAQQISQMVMAITRGDSPEKIHKMIALADKRQQERAQELQQMQQQMQAMQQAREDRLEQEKMRNEYIMNREDNETKERIAALNMFRLYDQEVDQDEIPQYLEVADKILDMESKKKQLQQKDRELDIKEKQSNKKE